MSDENKIEGLFPNFKMCDKAMVHFENGYKYQMSSEYTLAEESYKKALEVEETAEGYTFLGWNYSYMGKVKEAIRMCKKAIICDPDFGNPFNDIGSYLMHLNQHDEAIEWLKRAKTKTRYDNPEYPYANLAKIYEHKGIIPLAIKEYRDLLEIAPNYPEAREKLLKLSAILN